MRYAFESGDEAAAAARDVGDEVERIIHSMPMGRRS